MEQGIFSVASNQLERLLRSVIIQLCSLETTEGGQPLNAEQFFSFYNSQFM
jgi:hypothetical protein